MIHPCIYLVVMILFIGKHVIYCIILCIVLCCVVYIIIFLCYFEKNGEGG